MNILLITTDEQTYDALGAAGNPLVKTPHLDRLASQGVRLARHTCSSPVSTPARASILTGLYTRTHGAWHVGYELDKHRATIAHRLADAGYVTGVFGKVHLEGELTERPARHPVDEPYYGFMEHAVSEDDQRGRYFQWVLDNHPQYADEIRRTTHEGSPLREGGETYEGDGGFHGLWPTDLPEEVTQTHWIAEHARQFLDRRAADGKPFFAFCSFVQPHHPWNPPKSYMDQYDSTDMPVPDRTDGAHGGPTNRYNDGRKYSDRLLQEAQAAYYAMCTQIDVEVGKLLDRLDRHGMVGDTLVVFTSDHGDYNCRRGMIRKNAGWYESIMRVPTIMRLPGGAAGTVYEGPTQHEDIVPTMLEFLGLEPQMDISGVSLVPVLRGEDARPREWSFHEFVPRGGPGGPATVGISSERWKLIRYPDQRGWVLTDLMSDPEENENLIDTPEGRAAVPTMKDALLEWLATTPQWRQEKEVPW